jgi:methanogenic corrinoid protein MtbC1
MLFNVPNVIALIRDLRARSPKLRILLGGSAFRTKPGLWAEIGADGFGADLRAAVAAADRLIAE